MTGVLGGFAVIFVIIAVGYVVGVRGTLGGEAQQVLGQLVFFVATPALLFASLAKAKLADVFSTELLVAAVSAVVVAAGYLLLARSWLHRAVPETVIGALSASYVNSANLGIPVAVFVLDDASLIVPLLLFQIVVYSPVALSFLDVTTAAPGRSRSATLTAPLRNPMVLAGIAGTAISATGWTPPELVLEPFELLGGASVPGAPLAFGLSLRGARVLEPGGGMRRDVVVASVLKTVGQPVAAWVVAGPLLGLGETAVFTAVVLAALPTAQNVFVYALRYGRAVALARDTALITTVAAIPTMLIIAAVLG